jgi:polyphosphate glucokinase
MKAMEVLGIDIGGSGIKGAPVDTETGSLLAPRYRIPTPYPAKPNPMIEVVAEIAHHFEWQSLVGCGFPSALHAGEVLTAANIHRKWLGVNAAAEFSKATGCPTWVVNDADAAGVAEMTFGAGAGRRGVVLIVTIGTGLGSALFVDGQLLPNTEFGHIEMDGRDAELQASDAARQREKLSWKRWARRFDRYLQMMESLIWPDLIILGGGVIKKHEKFLPYLNLKAEVVPAQLLNEAGIVGAALAAQQQTERGGIE